MFNRGQKVSMALTSLSIHSQINIPLPDLKNVLTIQYCLVFFCIFALNISGTYNMYSDAIIVKLGIVLFINSLTELDKINIIKIIIMVMMVTVTTCRACTMLADIMLFDLFDLIRRRC